MQLKQLILIFLTSWHPHSITKPGWLRRTSAVEKMVPREQAHPVIAQIIAQADQFSAVDMIEAEYERAQLARQINLVLSDFDALMVPTAPTIYTIRDVEADPLIKNSHGGYQFRNLQTFCLSRRIAFVPMDYPAVSLLLLRHGWIKLWLILVKPGNRQ